MPGVMQPSLVRSRKLFALTMNLVCFRCGRHPAELEGDRWRATGYSKVHGHWAVCEECYLADRAARAASPSTAADGS